MAPAPTTTSDRAGRFVQQGSGPDAFWAFHPNRLPPKPRLEIDATTQELLDRANQALGRLDGVTLLLPDPDQFLYTFIRKEAVLSSQIEGTQSSLSDLLLFENDEAPGVPRQDAEETANYITAMNHGISQVLDPKGVPISSRLLREVHSLLLSSGRGSSSNPGEFRREQNWIGGTRPGNARFVPPPWAEVEPAIADLARFLHDMNQPTPILVKAAVAHAQFETIHPFLDGNGRVGRLLITLLLCSQGVLRRPLLYLSLFFKTHRDTYYEHLQRVRLDGAWEPWLKFFLEGVIEVAESTTETTQRLVRMLETDRRTINEFGRAAGTAHRVHDLAARMVVIRPPFAASLLEITEPPVYGAIRRLEGAGILREVTGRQRGKLYVYNEYLAILNEGTTDPP